MPNRLFLNDGQGGFREAPDGGVGDDGLSYGLAVGDVDNDGDLDMLQGAQGESRSILYLNLGEGQFLDVTEGVGLADLAQGGHSLPVMGDFDNDGDLDLMISEALRLFLNNGDGNFTEVTEPFGVANSPRGALWLTIGDYTGDGFLDVATGIGLSRNNGNSNHFLRVELAGVQSNRNGIGARVIATSGDLEQTRQILGGSGIVQAEMVAHFGLGSRTGVDRLEVRWPSGQVTVLENLPVDQQIRVIEGRDEYHVVRPTSWETAPPAGLPAGSTTRFAVEVRPALFEPGANITSVSADLSALGRPELVPLAPTGNGTYRLTTFLDVDERRSLREVSIAIEQNTSLGPHWTELSRTIAVAAPTDLALFGDMVAGEWTLNRQWLTNLSQHDAEDGLLWWAPDGQQIGFHSNREGNWEIYVMDVDGSNLVNLTNHPNPDGGATWSPDGTKILFNPIRRGTYRIHVMDADGSNVVELVEHPEFHGFPRWSPDGRQIAFSSTRDGGSSELYVMDADGSNIVRLTHHPHWDGFSRWSPDGQKIAFVSYRDGSGEFYILDLDAAEQVVLHPDERGVVYEGQTALRVEAAEPDVGESWKVLYRASERLDLAGYTTLRFAFHPGDLAIREDAELSVALGESRVSVLDSVQLVGLDARVNLDEDGIDLDRREWQVVELPLSFFHIEAPIDGVIFSGNLAGTFYLDDVRLLTAVETTRVTAIEDGETAIPAAFALDQNYPNPFNSGTVINFDVPSRGETELTVFNLTGQKAATLAHGVREAGQYTLRWDGRDDVGQSLASGVYLYRLRAGDRVATRKLLLLR